MWVYTCCLLLVSTYLYRYVLCFYFFFVLLLFVFGVLSTIQRGRKLHASASPNP